jgi:hypothetical protein
MNMPSVVTFAHPAPIGIDLGKVRLPGRRSSSLVRPIHWDVATVVVGSMLDRVREGLRGSLDEVGPAMTDLLSVLWSVKCIATPAYGTASASQCLATRCVI